MMKTDAELLEMLRRAAQKVHEMTQEERDKMFAEQRRNIARAELSWPKPRYRFVHGIKVYESYEDYCA